MGKWLQRARGALGMGVVWGAAWASLGFVPRWVLGIDGDLPFPILFAGLGFFSGVTFSGLLALTEGRRRLDQMSIPRFAGWGALGGLLLGGLFVGTGSYDLVKGLAIGTTFVVACAVSASGSLALARRAARQELPPGDRDIAAAGLSENEKRNLLGGGD